MMVYVLGEAKMEDNLNPEVQRALSMRFFQTKLTQN